MSGIGRASIPGAWLPPAPPQRIPHLRGTGADGGPRGTLEKGVQGVSVPSAAIDPYRKRWRRMRRRLRLADPLAEDFGTGGLAHHAQDVYVPFVILPSDPEVHAIDFDEPFWDWWMQDRPNPFEGASATHWGREPLPEATAAITEQSGRRGNGPGRDGQYWEMPQGLFLVGPVGRGCQGSSVTK